MDCAYCREMEISKQKLYGNFGFVTVTRSIKTFSSVSTDVIDTPSVT